jgi:hypothetical protein
MATTAILLLIWEEQQRYGCKLTGACIALGKRLRHASLR